MWQVIAVTNQVIIKDVTHYSSREEAEKAVLDVITGKKGLWAVYEEEPEGNIGSFRTFPPAFIKWMHVRESVGVPYTSFVDGEIR
jgi:hypothetical protein